MACRGQERRLGEVRLLGDLLLSPQIRRQLFGSNTQANQLLEGAAGCYANAADADFDRGALVTLNAAVVSGNSSIDFGNGGAGGLGYLGGFTFFGNFPSYDIDYGVVTATLAPASTTPEPSAFVLLGTGLLGAVAVGKNRLRS